jgi:hypothetical protein
VMRRQAPSRTVNGRLFVLRDAALLSTNGFVRSQ